MIRPFVPCTAFAVCVVFLGLAGCAPQVVTGAAQAAFEDRKTETQVTDAKITAGVLKRLAEKEKSLLLDVSVDVWEGRAMLTGTLDDETMRDAVEAVVRDDSRVGVVYNEIRIVTRAEQEERRELMEKAEAGAKAVGKTANDVWIAAKIQAKLVATRGVTSVNYRWRAVHDVVFVIGRARSQAELATVIDVIRATDGVDGVKHFIEIKPAAAG